MKLKKLIIFLFLISSSQLIYSQLNWMNTESEIYLDSIENEDISDGNTNIVHGFSLEIFGPYFLSSLGYNLEKPIKHKIALQFDFRIASLTAFSGSYTHNGWKIGPSFNQSILFWKKFRLKLGVTEGIVFNPPSILGKFDSRQPWDRPPKYIFYFSGNIGCEIRIVKNLFFISPEVNFVQLNFMKYTSLDQNQLSRISDFSFSFGIDFKFRL